MRALIIEDEVPAAEALAQLIVEVAPETEIVGTLESIEESVEWFQSNPRAADMVFMDIHLADGPSFSIFDSVEIHIPVIFTTAYDQYALKAFTVNSVDYLLKPISRQDLTRAIDKYKRLYASGEEMQTVTPKMMENLIESLRGGGGYKRSLLISYKDKIIPVLVDDIAIIYIECTMVKLSTFSGHIYYLNQTLDDVMSQLDPRRFFRANRQQIVSKDAVKELSTWFGGKLSVSLTVSFNDKIIVSKARAGAFKQWLSER